MLVAERVDSERRERDEVDKRSEVGASPEPAGNASG
jgi:hypothetical protein